MWPMPEPPEKVEEVIKMPIQGASVVPRAGVQVNEAAQRTIAHEPDEDSTDVNAEKDIAVKLARDTLTSARLYASVPYLLTGEDSKLDDVPEESHNQSDFAMRPPGQLVPLIPKAEADDDVNAQTGEYGTALQAVLTTDHNKSVDQLRAMTALAKVEAIAANFNYQLVPRCIAFMQAPPEEKDKMEYEHKSLTETILRQVLLKVDAVDTKADKEAKAKQKGLVRDVERWFNRLDSFMKGREEKEHRESMERPRNKLANRSPYEEPYNSESSMDTAIETQIGEEKIEPPTVLTEPAG